MDEYAFLLMFTASKPKHDVTADSIGLLLNVKCWAHYPGSIGFCQFASPFVQAINAKIKGWRCSQQHQPLRKERLWKKARKRFAALASSQYPD
jgi:hypothetical protein